MKTVMTINFKDYMELIKCPICEEMVEELIDHYFDLEFHECCNDCAQEHLAYLESKYRE